MSSPHQPGERKDSPSAQMPTVYQAIIIFSNLPKGKTARVNNLKSEHEA
jgi:hypothetical protein